MGNVLKVQFLCFCEKVHKGTQSRPEDESNLGRTKPANNKVGSFLDKLDILGVIACVLKDVSLEIDVKTKDPFHHFRFFSLQCHPLFHFHRGFSSSIVWEGVVSKLREGEVFFSFFFF